MCDTVSLCLYFRGQEEKLRLVGPELKELQQGLIKPRLREEHEKQHAYTELKLHNCG